MNVVLGILSGKWSAVGSISLCELRSRVWTYGLLRALTVMQKAPRAWPAGRQGYRDAIPMIRKSFPPVLVSGRSSTLRMLQSIPVSGDSADSSLTPAHADVLGSGSEVLEQLDPSTSSALTLVKSVYAWKNFHQYRRNSSA